jgi:hypothetical protein
VTGDEVRDMWLLDGGGYRASEVDDLLSGVAAELDAGRPARPLIENATFRTGSGKKGYDFDAVDWLLEQLLLPEDYVEPGEAVADPWHDFGDVTQLVRGGVSGLARRYPLPQKPTRRKAWGWFAEQCENAWRDFSEQPGVQLRCEKTQGSVYLWELRTADQQTLVSLDFGGPGRVKLIMSDKPRTDSSGGRRFTFQTMDRMRSSSPVIAEIAARAARDKAGHFAEPARGRPPSVRGLVDEAGTPILYISGENFGWSAYFCVTFPDGRWLRFLVRGTKEANAIMTAVDQAGNKVARYRVIDSGHFDLMANPDQERTFEITVNPGQKLTDDLALALAIPAKGQLTTYFGMPN